MRRKTVFVYDVAAQDGGGLAMLREYYKHAKSDTGNNFVFILSKEYIEETNNIKVLCLPWVKKSWVHRFYCDVFYIPRLLKKIHIDEALSLQNIAIRGCRVPQTVYVQNCIPFSDYFFSLIKSPKFWIYQNIIGAAIKRSLKHADKIIVQTKWMKESVARNCNIDYERIIVDEVQELDFSSVTATQKYDNKIVRFFYPAFGYPYKNHRIIVDAVKQINKNNDLKYEVIFTLNENDGRVAKSLYNEVQIGKLPIRFVGKLGRNEMKELYQKSILLFPSYMETVGLPIKEAMSLETEMILSDLIYAHDAAKGCQKVTYIKPNDVNELAEVMKKYITGKV